MTTNLKIGDIIQSRYEIVCCLGAGSMGYVYACRDKELSGRTVAIKVLYDDISSDKAIMTRFRNEVSSFYRITHPNVVRAYEYIRDGSLHAFTMEYVDGGDLAHRLEEVECLSYEETLSILKQIASGLQAIHETGIIHRDIKPENVLLSSSGVVKITDFGISLCPTGPRLTEDGRLLGTIPYLSPEYLGNATTDERSDLYSVGILAYEMLTNILPFEGKNVFDSMRMRLEQEAAPLELIRRDCPAKLSEIIRKLLQRNPDRRYQSAETLLNELEKVVIGDQPAENVKLELPTPEPKPLAPVAKRSNPRTYRSDISVSGTYASGQRMHELYGGLYPIENRKAMPFSLFLGGIFILGLIVGGAILLLNGTIA